MFEGSSSQAASQRRHRELDVGKPRLAELEQDLGVALRVNRLKRLHEVLVLIARQRFRREGIQAVEWHGSNLDIYAG